MRFVSSFVALLLLSSQTWGQLRDVVFSIVDADSRQPIAARIYLQSDDGTHHFVVPDHKAGSAVRYEKRNWINHDSQEHHTTVSAHRCRAALPRGKYTLIVERGKTYFPHRQQFEVGGEDFEITVPLKRWIDMAARHWYSGDTHIHRGIDELRNVVLAEDLNVVFPLTNWVTLADTPPKSGDKNLQVELPDALIHVDDQHVIWPRSTEYEIFTVGKKRHTLGALFVLGHRGALEQTVPPWKPVVEAARAADPDVLLDMDKLAWPFAMTLPVIAPDATYELANNHMWRTEFAFRNWYTPAPPFIQPPFGGTEGGEREWIDFTFGMYYTLLNCGFRMPPSAGTANGVHPVPAGFGRVYVHLPGGFDYQAWRQALQAGRSFVTTGPMVFATAQEKQPGHVFKFDAGQQIEIPLNVEVVSEFPLTFGEILVNGRPQHLLRARGEKTESGAHRAVIDQTIRPRRSGWFAVRFFEDRDDGRVRFAHTAPWYVEVGDGPVKPRRDEREYLVNRMQHEIQRSRGVVSEAALQEYQQALDYYRGLPLADDQPQVARSARTLREGHRDRWLKNMIVDHRFTADEVRLATGMSIDRAEQAVTRMRPVDRRDRQTELKILPYPGGRHPRRGFLDGAIDPQRETKISVFPPWRDGGYAVVDVPEAVFSNLGLTYLAHTHIPTIWSAKSVDLAQLEWTQTDAGWEVERVLPNGIKIGSRVAIQDGAVAMEMRLVNGTDEMLSGLRSQVCVMLKGLVGFNAQRRRDTVVEGPFIAIKADKPSGSGAKAGTGDSDRWIITAWKPNHRAWDNPPVPCIHSDPIFPDCPPGQTVRAGGGLWFYDGDNIGVELARLKESTVFKSLP